MDKSAAFCRKVLQLDETKIEPLSKNEKRQLFGLAEVGFSNNLTSKHGDSIFIVRVCFASFDTDEIHKIVV